MTDIEEALLNKRLEPLKIEMAKKDMLHYARWIFEKHYQIAFAESWYHEYLCKTLMAVYEGKITRLIINIPPGYGKTEFAVKLFFSWCMGQNSNFKGMYVTYSDNLATKTPSNTKQIITSNAYSKVFGNKKLNKTADQEWYLDKNGREDGGMYSSTIKGAVTGFHADILVIDDPMKAIEANSKAARDETIEFYESSATSRLKKTNPNSAIIIIMQRLHDKDLVGHLLEEEPEDWSHICLTGFEEHDTEYEFLDFSYYRKAFEPLNAGMESIEKLQNQKNTMKGKWYSQYMQDPKNIETGYVIEDDFTEVAKWEIPEDNKCISIDPAQSIKETADNRAISLVGVFETKEKIELYNVYGTWYGKWKKDEFIDQIITVMIDNPGVPVFMESSGGGILVEQDLRKKIKQVNADRKQEGKPILTNRIKLFNPKTSISKNQKLETSIDMYLKHHQIRFVKGAPGQEQVKKEYKGFHPEKDSKEDDCIETIANVVVNDFIVAKRESKPKSNKQVVHIRRQDYGATWNI